MTFLYTCVVPIKKDREFVCSLSIFIIIIIAIGNNIFDAVRFPYKISIVFGIIKVIFVKKLR